jgi:Mitochondrial small ribosomal subunit Rsm22
MHQAEYFQNDWHDLQSIFMNATEEVGLVLGYPTLGNRPPGSLAKLGENLAALSQAYNISGTATVEHLPARLAFSLVRDIPKSLFAASELLPHLHARLHHEGAASLTIADLGSGLGATSYGVAVGLAAMRARIEDAPPRTLIVRAFEPDARVRQVAEKLFQKIKKPFAEATGLTLEMTWMASARELSLMKTAPTLVLMGQVLSEMDQAAEPSARVQKHATEIARIANLPGTPTVLVIEPALKARSRHLLEVRRALLALGSVNIVAPCTHLGACPMLAREGDWCHEDIDVDLPEDLAGLAKRAGLRWQGLTFSYLVAKQKPDGFVPAETTLFRAIAQTRKTKGKLEAMLCGKVETDDPQHDEDGELLPPATLLRLMRVDRDASAANAALDGLKRGDVVRVQHEAILAKRVGATQSIEVVPFEVGLEVGARPQ